MMHSTAKSRCAGGVLSIVATYLVAVFTLTAICLAVGLQYPHDIYHYENLVNPEA